MVFTMVFRFQYQITRNGFFGLSKVFQHSPFVLRAHMTEAILLIDFK